MNEPASVLWAGLFAVAAVAIAADLLLHRRSSGAMSARAALLETAAWIALALVFDAWIFQARGRSASIQFLSGYLVEKSLSIDNIFLFVVIFHTFRVPPRAQHRVLYYGVAAALALRAAFVFAGVELLDHFHQIAYVFGAILFVTALRMVIPRRQEAAGAARIVKLAGRFFPVTENDDGEHFFVRENGKLFATSLFLALLTIEIADVIFAADSIPAVLSITRSTFIAYSSNVFAVLGLRAIYFVLAGVLRKIRFLHQGLAAVLIFTAVKMVLGSRISFSDTWSLAVIAAIFAATAAASLLLPQKG